MSRRLDTIIALFENDDGGVWSHNERRYALNKWNALTEEQRKFLEDLSVEDLDNVCTGERRGENDVCYRGLWRPLPPGVDEFLHDIWETCS